jgi:antitoxin (DNA-binding transcriptional repressor) of toxin-antitoxin stability system
MIQVKISQLKNQLSRYLKAVQRGETIEVLDRKVAIARLLPVQAAGGTGDSRRKRVLDSFFEEQVRLGIIRPPAGKIPAYILREKPPGKPGVLAALIAERRAGR